MIREASQPTGMTAMLGRYPEYRDSGVPWIEDCPSYQNWRIDRLKNVARVRLSNVDKLAQDGELPVLLCNYVNVYKNDFISPKIQFVKATATHQEVREFGLRAGDVLITKDSESWDDIGVPAVVTVDMPDVLCGYHLAIVRPDSNLLIGEFLMRALGAPEIAAQFHVAANGITRFGLSLGDITSIRVPLPPLDEQSAIVKYLAHVDRKIDRFIRAKRRMIELLNEQKQAIVHQAVTKGLDPSVPMKDSGVEWLGEIPAHWNVSRSKRLFGVSKELARTDDAQLSATQAYGVIRQDRFEELVGRRVVKLSMHLDKRKHVEKDDFVISMRSFQGGIERSWETGAIRSSYVVLKPSGTAIPSYFQYLLKSKGYISALQATAYFIRDGQDLTFENFAQVDLPYPPVQEQEQIARAIEESAAHSDMQVAMLEKQISLVREMRTCLISNVVTGKLDVRSVTLPDDTEIGKVQFDEEPDDPQVEYASEFEEE